jgi:hypothetical protein
MATSLRDFITTHQTNSGSDQYLHAKTSYDEWQFGFKLDGTGKSCGNFVQSVSRHLSALATPI